MTEKELLIAFLESTGVLYKTYFIFTQENNINEHEAIYVGRGDLDPYFDGQTEKVKGYTCFFTKYVFNKDGRLSYMGAYE